MYHPHRAVREPTCRLSSVTAAPGDEDENEEEDAEEEATCRDTFAQYAKTPNASPVPANASCALNGMKSSKFTALKKGVLVLHAAPGRGGSEGCDGCFRVIAQDSLSLTHTHTHVLTRPSFCFPLSLRVRGGSQWAELESHLLPSCLWRMLRIRDSDTTCAESGKITEAKERSERERERKCAHTIS